MKLEIYAIRDITQNQVMRPMFMVNDGDATRQFTEIVNNADAQNMIGKYPEQFELLCLGEYETDNGTITPHDVRSLGTGTAFKR